MAFERINDWRLPTFIGLAHLAVIVATAEAAGVSGNTADENAFYVGSHGWHTSIIIPRARILTGAWPRDVTSETFAGFRYLEIGWGDRKFYTAPKPNALMALDAALLPGPSVLHIVGLDSPLERALPWSALVRAPCTRQELTSLSRALGDSFDLDARGHANPVGRGLYGRTSRFYAARGRYYLFNTCDTWTARMMRAGGLPADRAPTGTWSARAVIAQARRLVVKRKEATMQHSAGTLSPRRVED